MNFDVMLLRPYPAPERVPEHVVDLILGYPFEPPLCRSHGFELVQVILLDPALVHCEDSPEPLALKDLQGVDLLVVFLLFRLLHVSDSYYASLLNGCLQLHDVTQGFLFHLLDHERTGLVESTLGSTKSHILPDERLQ